ncbi:MAG: Uncharacterized protein G01um101493_205 [Microgenomates group bacterium Gr01-1014_93]|nr:MAG: Uncharacterized protein G01um101493_205 [Microgenomates group bacterium Gr01-1014_93]
MLPEIYYIAIIVLLLIAYFWQLNVSRRGNLHASKTVEEAHSKSLDIIHSAIKKSQDIQSQAEIESLRITAEGKLMDDKFQDKIQAETNQLFEKFEENLSNYLTQTQNRSTKAIELELQAARSLIDSYKSGQLRVIDENIVAILEKTLSIILTKKLSLADQMDLVYKALEKAKAEKFFV